MASRSGPLTRAGASLSAAAHDGHQIALALVLLAVLQVGAIFLFAKLERSIRIAPRVRRDYVYALCAALAAIIVGAVRIGNPVTFVNHATDAFTTESASSGGDLNRRLITLSGHTRADYWRAAWQEVRDNPVLGGGGETFRRYWLRYRPVRAGVLNAHDLYLETLAELGPVGLVLLLTALAVPLLAIARARENPIVPITAGAYVAALAHAAIDWDWQLPALTLATFALGATLVTAARAPAAEHRLRMGERAAALLVMLAVVAFVFVAQLGNDAVAASERAATRGDYPGALADARSARDLLPWTARPWQQIGEAQFAEGELDTARASFRAAIRRDGSNSAFWRDLALTLDGQARRKALAEATRLNPLSPALHASSS